MVCESLTGLTYAFGSQRLTARLSGLKFALVGNGIGVC